MVDPGPQDWLQLLHGVQDDHEPSTANLKKLCDMKHFESNQLTTKPEHFLSAHFRVAVAVDVAVERVLVAVPPPQD